MPTNKWCMIWLSCACSITLLSACHPDAEEHSVTADAEFVLPHASLEQPHGAAPRAGDYEQAMEKINQDSKAARTNAGLERMARLLARSMNDALLRKAIKAEALKQFDGDYDILYSQFAKAHLVNGSSLHERLARAASSDSQRQLSVEQAGDELDSISTAIPRLNISVPVNILEWDAESYVPLVAVSPAGVPDGSLQYVKAFDAQGKLHWLSTQEEPGVPVVVVGQNERVDDEGQLLHPKPEGTHDIMTLTTSQHVILRCIEVKDYSEQWINGGPEFRLRVIAPANNEELYYNAFNYSRDRKWHCYDTYIISSWQYGTHGNELYYIWYEDDGGTSRDWSIDVSFTLPNNGGSFSAKISWTGKDKDEQLSKNKISKTIPSEYQNDPLGSSYYWSALAGTEIKWTFVMGHHYFDYNTSNTNYATQNTMDQRVSLTAGEVITVGTCDMPRVSRTGDTYLRLLSPDGSLATYNDDACNSWASKLVYTAHIDGVYTIKAGCYASGSCSGRVGYHVR